MERGLTRVLRADFQEHRRKRPGVGERAWRRLKRQYYESMQLTLNDGKKMELAGWVKEGQTAHERILSILKQNNIMCSEIFHEEFGDGLGPIVLERGKVVRDFQFYVNGMLPLIEVDGGFCGLNANNVMLKRGMRLELKEEAPTCGLGNRVANTKGIRVMEWASLDPSTGFIHSGGTVFRPVEKGAEIIYQPLISTNPRGLELQVPGAALAQDFASNKLREILLLRPWEQEWRGTIEYYYGIGARVLDAALYLIETMQVGKHLATRHSFVEAEKSMPSEFFGDWDWLRHDQEIFSPTVVAKATDKAERNKHDKIYAPAVVATEAVNRAEAPVQPVLPNKKLVLEESSFDEKKWQGIWQKESPKSSSISDLAVERRAAEEKRDLPKDTLPLKVVCKLMERYRERDGQKQGRKKDSACWKINSRGQMKPVFAPSGMHPVLGAERVRRVEKVQESKKRMVGRIHSRKELIKKVDKIRGERGLAMALRKKAPVPIKEEILISAKLNKRNRQAEIRKKEAKAKVANAPSEIVKFRHAALLSSEAPKEKRKVGTVAVPIETKKKEQGHKKKQIDLLNEKKKKKRRRKMEEYLVVSKPAKKRKRRNWLSISKR